MEFAELGDQFLLISRDNDGKIYVMSTESYDLPIICEVPDAKGTFALGSFTKSEAKEMVVEDGSLWFFNSSKNCFDKEEDSFPFELGSYITAMDTDNDGINEVLGFSGLLKLYSALDMSIVWTHSPDIWIDSLDIFDVDGDGRLDVIYGDDQWGALHALDGETGKEFWSLDNPEHGVTSIVIGDLNGDGQANEIAWGGNDLIN